MSDTATPIVQFGTSRFLQAHADLFFSEGKPARRVTVVQNSGDPNRARRLAAISAPDGYPVRLRGIEDGAVIDEEHRVTSVTRALSTATEWEELERVVIEEAEVILSNTGDTGFEPSTSDIGRAPEQGMSYPAKLFHLLRARHAAGRAPLTIFPMELISRNGDVLKARVLDLARLQDCDASLMRWLESCIWANSLVDRIVSESIEPVGAVAEPYALWAIEAQPGLIAPTRHPAIELVESLDPVERLKLHILNLGHTAMVSFAQEIGADEDANVRKVLEGEIGERLKTLFRDEVIPGLAAYDMEDSAKAYLDTTLERFANPFIDHRLADIAQHHRQKLDRRIGAFIAWVRRRDPAFEAPKLESML